MAVKDPLGEPQIYFKLTAEATATFAKLTGENLGRRLAIVLDGELYSAPVIQAAIEGGSGQITGHFQAAEAWAMASVLETPLDVPLRIVEEKAF
jgi:preprotein translocase subunit SecD